MKFDNYYHRNLHEIKSYNHRSKNEKYGGQYTYNVHYF